jgi:hypothetical protein
VRLISNVVLPAGRCCITNLLQSACKLGVRLWRHVLRRYTTARPRPGHPLNLRLFSIDLHPRRFPLLRPLSRIRIAAADSIIIQDPLGRLGCPTLQRATHDCARPRKRGRTCLELLGVHGWRLPLPLAFPVPYWCRRWRRGRRCHLDVLRGWKRCSAWGCSLRRG